MAYNKAGTRRIIRGDTDKFKIVIFKRTVVKNKPKKVPVDITGWNVKFTVRDVEPSSSTHCDRDALISVDGYVTNPEQGIAVIYVPAEMTYELEPGTYWYDIQFIKPMDEFGYRQVKSIQKAKYIVEGDITRNECIRHSVQVGHNHHHHCEDEGPEDYSDGGYTI